MSSLEDNDKVMDNETDKYKSKQVKEQTKLEKWQLALIIIGIGLLVAFIFVRSVVWVSENNPKQKYRDLWSKIINHSMSLIPSVVWNPKNFPIRDMDNGVWNRVQVPAEFSAPTKKGDPSIVSVMILRQPKPNVSAVNWLRLENISSLVSPPKTVLYFHGASLTNEYYYRDFKAVSSAINANIILIEYPGYGDRKKQSRSTEVGMMDQYPKEVYHILKDVLKIDWKDTIVWVNCMGSVIGLRTLWYIWNQQQMKMGEIQFPAAIYMTKPFASYRQCATVFLSGRLSLISRMAPPDLMNILYEKPGWNHELFSMCRCPVLITTGEKDKMSSEKLARTILDKFINAQWRRFTMIKNAGHTINTVDIVSSEIQRTI